MAASRRNVLKSLVAAAGAGIGGVWLSRLARAEGGEEAKPAAGNMPMLGANGKLAHDHHHSGSATAMTFPPASDPTGRKGVPGRKWVMVLDLSRCDGCGKCTEACGKMHFIPPDRQWIPVLVMRESRKTAPYYFPRPCFHCDQPPCTKVCPVNATYKTQDGTVLVDNERCIGCRFCIAACPYGVRVFNWGKPPAVNSERGYNPQWGYPRQMGTVEKCDFCPDHGAAGELPACSSGCPMGVIYYGDENEDAVTNSFGETVRLSKFLKDKSAYRFLEDLGTEPRVYYLPPVFRQYPAPGETTKG
jgi:molybdopterin-containing oxidoreductase family iron-sulfur binding subunit